MIARILNDCLATGYEGEEVYLYSLKKDWLVEFTDFFGDVSDLKKDIEICNIVIVTNSGWFSLPRMLISSIDYEIIEGYEKTVDLSSSSTAVKYLDTDNKILTGVLLRETLIKLNINKRKYEKRNQST